MIPVARNSNVDGAEPGNAVAWARIHAVLAPDDVARRAWLDAQPDCLPNPKASADGAKGKGRPRKERKEPRLRHCVDCPASFRTHHFQIRCEPCRQVKRAQSRGAAKRTKKRRVAA